MSSIDRLIITASLLLFMYGAVSASGDNDNLVTAIPRNITYQGILADSQGNPVSDGTYDIIFRIYDSETSTTPLWNQTIGCSVFDGYFTSELPDVDLTFDTNYWLESF